VFEDEESSILSFMSFFNRPLFKRLVLSGAGGVIGLLLGGRFAAAGLAIGSYAIGERQFPDSGPPWPNIDKLMSETESGTLEFKARLSSEKGKPKFFNALKAIAAFANGSGGNLLIGVDDQCKVVGIKPYTDEYGNSDSLELALRQAIDKNIRSLNEKDYRLRFVEIAEHQLIQIEVQESSKRVFIGGKFYKRKGNASIECDAETLSGIIDDE